MKQIYILIIVFFTVLNINSQTTDIVTGVMALDIEIKGNDLYFSDNFRKRVSKIDINTDFSTVIDVTNRRRPFGLAIRGKDLYVSLSSGIPKMIKIDISDSDYVVSDFSEINISSFFSPIEIHGNELYYYDDGKIFKFNVNDDIPVITGVITGINSAYCMVIYGNELYFSDILENKISKINLNDNSPMITDVITNLNSVAGIAIHGNELYFSDLIDNKISKFNLNNPTQTIEDIVTDLEGPLTIAIKGQDLYISEIGSLKISKFSLASQSKNVNATKEKITNEEIRIYPNPAGNYINLTGFSGSIEFEIQNLLGQTVITGSISQHENLDVSFLQNGLYNITIENSKTIKFIKN